MPDDVLFSSQKMDWETPEKFFKMLDNEFGFTLDVCARDDNKKCVNYISPEEDALSKNWEGTCWMNPPYGRELKHWIKKAFEESQKGATVVCLIPARTDTKYWHDYCMKASEIRLVKGRLQFVGATSSAPFHSAVVVFDKSKTYPSLKAMLTQIEAEA